eukprot:2338794-Ditylum_brightwellii.AAC.1
MPFKEWYLMICNKECQQQEQDLDATVRIQSIIQGYSTQQQLHLQKISAISIQAVAHEFIIQQQMNTKHIAAVIIQTNFCLAYQQCIIYKNNDELLDA